MALLVKKVVVTEVPVDTVKLSISTLSKTSLHGADSNIAEWGATPSWIPHVLDIDVETGVIRNWTIPTADQLQKMVEVSDLRESLAEAKIVPVIPHYVTKDKTEKEWEAIIGGIKTNPATTTTENAQPVETADPVQPEAAETAPEAPQSNCGESATVKTPEIEGIKPVDSSVQKMHVADDLGQPNEAFADGVALAESVLVPVEPEPVADEPITTDLPTVTVSQKNGKWCALYNGEESTSTQGLYEAIKGVLKRWGKFGAFEINHLYTQGDNQVFTIDERRTANTETVYLTKMADGWVAKTPNNKTVTATISITGELTALLAPIDNIDDYANAAIVETTDDEIRSRGKRRYSITAAQPRPSYAQIVALINHASEVVHLDNIKAMHIERHADEKERHALVMKLGSKRAEIMAANAMSIK